MATRIALVSCVKTKRKSPVSDADDAISIRERFASLAVAFLECL
jgi:hypothetical protein